MSGSVTDSQRAAERRRFNVSGWATGVETGRCTLLVIEETSGTYCLYPHGWPRFGVRLDAEEAEALARQILRLDEAGR